MKLLDIVNSIGSLNDLYVCKKLDVNIAYRIAKNYKIISEEYEQFEKSKLELINKYADKNEHGEFVIVKNDNGVSNYSMTRENEILFNQQIAVLLNEDVDVSIKKVTLKEIEHAGLSGADLMVLEYMIEFDEGKQ